MDAVNLEIYFDHAGGILPAKTLANKLVDDGFLVIRRCAKPDRRHIFEILLPTCVSFCKIITNYRSKAITPDQLVRGLLRDGGCVHTNGV